MKLIFKRLKTIRKCLAKISNSLWRLKPREIVILFSRFSLPSSLFFRFPLTGIIKKNLDSCPNQAGQQYAVQHFRSVVGFVEIWNVTLVQPHTEVTSSAIFVENALKSLHRKCLILWGTPSFEIIIQSPTAFK